MKRLYIRGDNGNTKAVIDILESIGAVNSHHLDGSNTSMLYTYDRNGDIVQYKEKDVNAKNVYSYLQFYTAFPYKVNDTIIMKSSNKQCYISRMFWSEQYERIEYEITSQSGNERGLARVDEIKNEFYTDKFAVDGDMCPGVIDVSTFNDKQKIIFNSDAPNETEIEFNKDLFDLDIRNDKVYIVKKHPSLPKTVFECCNLLGVTMSDYVLPSSCYKGEEFEAYMKLMLCRDAYLKLANDWELKPGVYAYYIYYAITADEIEIEEGDIHGNVPLSFPTKYMRDEFYKNFKNYIVKAKRML